MLDMDRIRVREALIASIKKVLESCRQQVPDLKDETCPLDIFGFESYTWPYAMDDIAVELGIDIPDDVNIFLGKTQKGQRARRLTIGQIVDVILMLSVRQSA